jgi:predicted dinucleotide-binding enzyme
VPAGKEVVGGYGEQLAEKIVIYICNPVDRAASDSLAAPPGTSAAKPPRPLAR